jgi:hypothetical protein
MKSPQIVAVMKITATALLAVIFASNTFSRDLRPESWMEQVVAEDSSIQQCYVFRSIAGVAYRIESSDNLAQWTNNGEVYGLGHDHVVAMHEVVPPESTPTGGGGSSPPPIVVPKFVALRIQREQGGNGGTVIS